jgi:hypothetical protein
MRLTRLLAAAVVVVAVAAAAAAVMRSDEPRIPYEPGLPVAAERPPAPSGWPPYPRFPVRSCWTRPFGDGVLRGAPSFSVRSTSTVAPAEVVRALLARLGDRRFVSRIELAPPPPVTLRHLRGYFAGVRPPADAVWAYIAAPAATATLRKPSAAQVGAQMLAQWEAALVAGALRDDFCDARGRPLVGWTIGRGGTQVSDRMNALGQRFPNPQPQAFRAAVAAAGRRYGFRVLELRLLRPRQLAPLLRVETNRDRRQFVSDVPEIIELLNPSRSAVSETAVTFEGFFFEARDTRGPFVRTSSVRRGQVMGGQWSWNRCVYPYLHSQPVGAPPCP